ncbi:hypothetical protein GCM10009122_58580 [Fulvivirga kasyanovii]|uniref:DUF2007 domain-containing protein n=1 Tax=Fulvivirga kasyanovii TaxID=396812 RepID=A0ABW9RIP4_9BACT|nr:DUF2007 domain-containing protein [Fulvivirga kasyanovii]MTI23772.1 DUF2007 domain-containing protein [Fulvivirga kasyanovii]
MRLITLKTFDNSIEANLLRSKLESEGVLCFLFDENMVSLNPLYNLTLGGIKLKIREADAQKALQIIEEVETTPFTDEQDRQVRCPVCQSTQLYSDFKSMKGLKGVFTAIVSFLLFVFPFYYKSVYKCRQCNAEFRPAK